MDVNLPVDAPFGQLACGEPGGRAVSIDGTQYWTRAELCVQRNRFVNILRAAGIGQGDRVGMIMFNSLDYVALYFAAARIGAIAVRINFRLAPTELAYLIADSGCKAVIFDEGRIEPLETIIAGLSVQTWLFLGHPGSAPDWAVAPDVSAAADEIGDLPRPSGSDPVAILYSSGTTGRPKGCVWTHEATLWAASIQAMTWETNPRTVVLSAGPMHHVMGMEVMQIAALISKGSMGLLSSTGVTVDRVIDAVHKSGATLVWMPPFFIYELVRKEDLDPAKLASVRLFMTGGDTIQPWAVVKLREKLPHVALQSGYGLTEGGSIVTGMDPALAEVYPDSVGSPLPLTEVRVTREDGSGTPAGEIGEIRVRSPAVAREYWNLPEDSARTFVDGWCRTGDLGRVNEAGLLCITGRLKDMIRSGGENIYPAEIEAVMSAHDEVAALVVIAVPDQKYIEVGCAVAVLKDAAADAAGVESRLRALAVRSFAGFKRPKHYVFVDELPRTPTGKVQKAVLRERFAHLGVDPGKAG